MPNHVLVFAAEETWKKDLPSPCMFHCFQALFNPQMEQKDKNIEILLQNPYFTNSQYSLVLDKYVSQTWW